jgi:hypothetical protein
MVLKSAPASFFVVSKTEFLLQLLIIPFDDPTMLGPSSFLMPAADPLAEDIQRRGCQCIALPQHQVFKNAAISHGIALNVPAANSCPRLGDLSGFTPLRFHSFLICGHTIHYPTIASGLKPCCAGSVLIAHLLRLFRIAYWHCLFSV